MARIPLQVAATTLDSGSAVSVPQGSGPIGAAVEGVEVNIGRLADHVHQWKERHDTFDAAVREEEFLEDLERLERDAIGKALPDGEGLHDSVYGNLDPSTGRATSRSPFDVLFERHADRIPESRRAAFLAIRERQRESGSHRMAVAQLARRREFESAALSKIQERLLAGISAAKPSDGAAFRAIRQKGFDLIASMSVDEERRGALAAAWDRDAMLSWFETRLRQEPGFAPQARHLLGLTSTAPQ